VFSDAEHQHGQKNPPEIIGGMTDAKGMGGDEDRVMVKLD
jgi:hypothetical protein